VLEAHEREKKKKYLEAYLEQRCHFSLCFVVSTDGLLGKESHILLKKLSTLLAEKWEKPYSKICGSKCLNEHCHGESHSSLIRGLPNLNEPNGQPSSPMGRQGWTGNIPPLMV
jgi:hypothetical protein